MSEHLHRIRLGNVDLSKLNTEDDLRREARRALPDALRQLGEAMGEQAWATMQKGLKGPGIKLNTSAAERRKFIEESGRNHQREATTSERKRTEDYIVQQLRGQKQAL